MFVIGQLVGAVVLGLLFGAIAQSYAKGKNQPDLGNIALAICTVVTVLAGFVGFSHVAGLLTMVGFIVAASNK
jgi:4-hydroxybenzoate polyprenyltransferase